jgi:CDP-paratose 2-epimerase
MHDKDDKLTAGRMTAAVPSQWSPLRDRLGICQWFHFEDRGAVEKTVEAMHDLGVRHLRTGISWADFFRSGGEEWYRWQMDQLRDFEVLLSVWHTPPSISEGNACNSPPRRLRDFADFVDRIVTEFGDRYSALELWNEPNNRLKWDFPRFDPQWRKFAEMIGGAAYWAKRRGQTTVLGGMIPVDPHWLQLMREGGVLEYIDVVGIHAFPGMWFPDHPNWDWHDHWAGWADKVGGIRAHSGGRPIWCTETGLATYDLALRRIAKYEIQVEMLEAAAASPAERTYWYTLLDLDPGRDAIEGFHVDENEYHMGLINHWGERKPAYERMKGMMRATPNEIAPTAEAAGQGRSVGLRAGP